MSEKTLKTIRKSMLTFIMLALSVVVILPFAWSLSASLKPTADVFQYPIKWIPDKITFENYITVWNADFYKYFINSTIVSIICVIGEVITSALTGYAFAKIKFKGKNIVFIIFISTLMFPNQMLLIPRFVLYKLWGMYNTLWALILPGIFTAFGTFLFRQFFSTIPDDLMEASKLDGCSHFKTFWRIVLPLSMPVMSALIILSFVSTWNNYENPLVFLSNKKLFTIPLGLLAFRDDVQANYGAIMAASVCSLIPIFVIFFSLQKNFIEGIAMSGIKV